VTDTNETYFFNFYANTNYYPEIEVTGEQYGTVTCFCKHQRRLERSHPTIMSTVTWHLFYSDFKVSERHKFPMEFVRPVSGDRKRFCCAITKSSTQQGADVPDNSIRPTQLCSIFNVGIELFVCNNS